MYKISLIVDVNLLPVLRATISANCLVALLLCYLVLVPDLLIYWAIKYTAAKFLKGESGTTLEFSSVLWGIWNYRLFAKCDDPIVFWSPAKYWTSSPSNCASFSSVTCWSFRFSNWKCLQASVWLKNWPSVQAAEHFQWQVIQGLRSGKIPPRAER